ncbi:MAG: hypothetical protein IKM54_05975, partial [Butyricicoccus sp.]|nr:hypothetical protein [Butyricicoccus sp.]
PEEAPIFPEEPPMDTVSNETTAWEDPIRAPLWNTRDLKSEWQDPVIDFDDLDESDEEEGEEDDDA